MALKDLNYPNINNDLATGEIDNDYYYGLAEFLVEFLRITGWNGKDNELIICEGCKINVKYLSPRRGGGYKHWIWIEVLNTDCNCWVHINMTPKGLWRWSIWCESIYPDSNSPNYYMPPKFDTVPVYKTGNETLDLFGGNFNDICRKFKELCKC